MVRVLCVGDYLFFSDYMFWFIKILFIYVLRVGFFVSLGLVIVMVFIVFVGCIFF